MPAADTGLAKARHVFTKHGGMLRTANAIRLGDPPANALRTQGLVGEDRNRLESRTLPALLPQPLLSAPICVPIAIRIPRAVVCLISALAHHGLTTQVPHAVDLALPSHAQIPKIDGVPLCVFWYSEPSFSAGIENRRRWTRCRCSDLFAREDHRRIVSSYRNKITLDLAIEALRAYRDRTPKPNFQALAKFAQINRVQKVMRPYLEAVL